MKKSIKTLTILFFTLFTTVLVFAGNSENDIRTIHIKGMDNMKFDVELIEAAPGETIRIVLEVTSNMPKQAMAHNIAVISQDVDLEEFAMASMVARDTEYIAPEYENRVIAHTAMIGGGETSTIEFTVPETPGDYDYVCTFPGHYLAGMVGILRVQ